MQMAAKQQQMMIRCRLCDRKGGDKTVTIRQSVTNAVTMPDIKHAHKCN